MSGPLVSASAAFVAKNSRIPPFAIEQSLRFDGSSKLSRASAFGNANASWTLSFWFKRSRPLTTTDGDSQVLVWSEPPGGTSNTGTIQFFYDSRYTATKTNRILSVWSDTTEMFTPGVQRDFSAWYHLVIKSAATSGTSGTVTYYLNGVEQVSNTVAEAYMFGPNRQPNIGARASSAYFSGYMAEFHYVHGTTKNYTDFGEFDDNGVWRPIEYTGGSYGANGFYLKFDPSATNGIGHDHSGNGNNWTASGFTTSGTGTDVMSDTPTTNWATLNVLGKALSDTGSGTTSDGNLQITYSSYNWYGHKSTIAVSSGKWYYEVTNTSGTIYVYAGFSLVTADTETGSNVYRYRANGNKINTSATSYGSAWSSAGDICGVAFDADAGTIEFYKNGVSQGTAFSSIPAGTYAAEVMVEGSTTAVVNFGQRAFEYTPPTGFKALNTSNLSQPDIADGSEYFNTVLYTGTGSNLSITGVGFQPDWNWIKKRSASEWHAINDAVRGAGLYLSSNTTNAENSANGVLNSFDSDGFTVGAQGLVNDSGATYVAWNWLASNTSGSSNTDGSITSTVSANPSAGFSIVEFGTTGSTETYGHGLGVTPDVVLIKRTDNTGNWFWTYRDSSGAHKYLMLNSTNATTDLGYAVPTSTVFSWNNDNGGTSIAYCFAEVEGYSKFGSYTGNGSSDGVFIHLGFKPSFFLLKATSVDLESWSIFDSARDPDNFVNRRIMPNNSNQEEEYPSSGSATMDFLSNGVKLRASNTAMNGNGVSFIYAAFAENPFGGSDVSPATAR